MSGSRAACGSRREECCRSHGWPQTSPPASRCQRLGRSPGRRPTCLADSQSSPPSAQGCVPSPDHPPLQALTGLTVVAPEHLLERLVSTTPTTGAAAGSCVLVSGIGGVGWATAAADTGFVPSAEEAVGAACTTGSRQTGAVRDSPSGPHPRCQSLALVRARCSRGNYFQIATGRPAIRFSQALQAVLSTMR